ncbi:MAG TPA: peptidylprolyl isomerase [Holophagaceae bacterium]|nr:peptidylprolyl isomerase [Holophagaceae bacterium]
MIRRSLPALLLVLPMSAQSPAPAPVANPVVKIVTNYGAMTIELDAAAAPKTVANFLRYVKEGHYKGTVFHRVIDGFMIQGGGMDEKLNEKPAHTGIPNETASALASGLHNTRGTIALARTDDPNSGADQFYINLVDNSASLDSGSYCPFGRVISGMEVADAIAKVRTGFQKGMPNVPDFPVRIKDVQLVKTAAQ